MAIFSLEFFQESLALFLASNHILEIHFGIIIGVYQSPVHSLLSVSLWTAWLQFRIKAVALNMPLPSSSSCLDGYLIEMASVRVILLCMRPTDQDKKELRGRICVSRARRRHMYVRDQDNVLNKYLWGYMHMNYHTNAPRVKYIYFAIITIFILFLGKMVEGYLVRHPKHFWEPSGHSSNYYFCVGNRINVGLVRMHLQLWRIRVILYPLPRCHTAVSFPHLLIRGWKQSSWKEIYESESKEDVSD